MAPNATSYGSGIVIQPDRQENAVSQEGAAAGCGAKARGLLGIPPYWVPPFFVITAEILASWGLNAAPIGKPVEKWPLLGPDDLRCLNAALHQVQPDTNAFVMVRSSAVGESLTRRGRYSSLPCRAEPDDVLDAVRQVLRSGEQDEAVRMSVLVQRHVSPRRASGHLSNERRLTKRRTAWLCEFEAISGVGSPRLLRFSTQNIEPCRPDERLTCSDRQSLERSVAALAAWTDARKARIHYEWIWDGRVLWVVQADPDPDRPGSGPRALRDKGRSRALPSGLSLFVEETDIPYGRWPKLDCVKVFKQCHLPTVKFWVLEEERALAELGRGVASDEIRADLKKLLVTPAVIRTDICAENTASPLLLPRTTTVSSLEGAIRFLETTGRHLSKAIKSGARVCFILHHFIPARSSAFSYTEPGKKKVRVDGLWGLPDGLLFYAHDSYELNAKGRGPLQKRIRFKDLFLDYGESGEWVPKTAGRPWDWKSSLTDDELREVAKESASIAEHVGKCVQIMWFVGIPGQPASSGCLPWYFITDPPPVDLVAARSTDVRMAAPCIRKQDDLENLKHRIQDDNRPVAVLLKPLPELLRSKEFITGVAEYARDSGIAIQLEGSILSHAYYLLKASGVRVLCSDPFEPTYKEIRVDKLVRDLIPVRISAQGESVKVVRLTGEQLLSVLKSKAVEEALELFWTESRDGIKEEIIDLHEALGAMIEHLGLTEQEISKEARRKRSERGGFDEGIVLRTTQENPLIHLYRQALLLPPGVENEHGGLVEQSSVGANAIQFGKPRPEGLGVAIPLIPPGPEERHEGYAVNLPKRGLVVTIRFREKEVLVEFTPDKRPPLREAPGQLSLFDV